MKEIIQEYASAIVGVVGTVAFFVILGNLLYSDSGFFVNLIRLVVGGA